MLIDATPTDYTFFELDEQARVAALQAVAQTGHTTSDPGEPDQLAAALVAALAERFGHRCVTATDLEITVWDARRWSLVGTVHPDTAPALPWAPGIAAVSIAWHRRIHLHHTGEQPTPAAVQRMRTAVQAAIAAAWQTAQQRLEAWQALEWVTACRPRFTAAGALIPASRPEP